MRLAMLVLNVHVLLYFGCTENSLPFELLTPQEKMSLKAIL
jgi:hypothetical protein